MFIIVKNYTVNEAWLADDCYVLKDYDFDDTQSTVIIKGEALREELEKRGIALEQLPQDYAQKGGNEQKTWFRKGFKKSLQYQWDTVNHN